MTLDVAGTNKSIMQRACLEQALCNRVAGSKAAGMYLELSLGTTAVLLGGGSNEYF